MSKIVKGIAAIALIAVGVVTGNPQLIALGASVGVSALASKPKSPKISPESLDRLRASIDPRTPRKIVFGRTALATDIRDEEFTDNQTYFHRFIVCASHQVNSIDEIWFDDKLAWTAAGGVQGDFSGYLTVATRTAGTAANAINISSRMGSSRRYTGLAYVHLRYKLTGNSKKTDSPFAQTITSRITIVGNAALVYDPRLDSTVPGGSGPQRADDQSTWTWNSSASRNPALQMLWYMLGWRINGILAVGKGMPANRIDLPSFIDAANMCDETVTKAGGGTEPRYRSDGIFSESDSPTLVIDALKTSMNAELDDVGGKLRLRVLHNDLASPVATFTDDDIIGDFQWRPVASLEETFNVVRGVYTDPSNNSLYQQVDYPQVALASPDGIERAGDPFDLPMVQSPSQAQRLAKQRLQRQQYTGTFSADFQATGWKVVRGDAVALTFSRLGWTSKLFRVAEQSVRFDGIVSLTLIEESAAIYAWDAEEAPAVAAASPTSYDFTQNPVIAAIDDSSGPLNLVASRAQITYDGSGNPAPATQTTAFDVFRQGFSSPVVLLMSKADGSFITDPQTYLTHSGTTARNLLPYSDQFDQWTAINGAIVSANSATAPDGTMSADTITDANTSNFSAVQQTIAVPANSATYICTAFFRKTTGVTAAALFRINMGGGGPDQFNNDVLVNTNTGEVLKNGGIGTNVSSRSIGDYWLVTQHVANNGSNTYVQPVIFAAVAPILTGEIINPVYTASLTGAVTIWRAAVSTSPHGYLIATGATYRDGIVADNASLTEPNFASAAATGTGVSVIAIAGEPSGVLTDIASVYRTQDGVSAFTVSPASQSFTIAATASGTPKSGQLPKTVTFMVLQGATDLSDDPATTYSVIGSNCTATLGGTNNKVLTISAMSADSASASVTVQRGGVTIATVPVTLVKARDGATGGTSNSDTTLTINNTSSYTGVQGGPFSLAVGPNGTITLDVDHNYTVASSTATMLGKLQYRTTVGSGAWIDIGSEASGTTAFPGEPGSLTFTRTLSGPASAATWEFQYINRKTASGTLSNTGTNIFSASWGA